MREIVESVQKEQLREALGVLGNMPCSGGQAPYIAKVFELLRSVLQAFDMEEQKQETTETKEENGNTVLSN